MEIELKSHDNSSSLDVYIGTQKVGLFYFEVDGFWVFNSTGTGYWNEYSLRLIADKLEELNKSWNDQLNEYFKIEDEK
jgi:hypothetical protein